MDIDRKSFQKTKPTTKVVRNKKKKFRNCNISKIRNPKIRNFTFRQNDFTISFERQLVLISFLMAFKIF